MPGIIVGIDGSEHSQRALEWAVTEAGIRRAPLTVITVNETVVGFWSGGPVVYPGDEEITEKARALTQEETDRVVERLDEEVRPASVTVRAVTGLPADELITASADADMVVVGSRGAGGFTRLLMGSVSTQVTHHAHCPVVVIPTRDN